MEGIKPRMDLRVHTRDLGVRCMGAACEAMTQALTACPVPMRLVECDGNRTYPLGRLVGLGQGFSEVLCLEPNGLRLYRISRATV